MKTVEVKEWRSRTVKTGVTSASVNYLGRVIKCSTSNASGILFPTNIGLSLVACMEAYFAESQIDISDRSRYLDIGAGSGIHTVAASMAGFRNIESIDPNPEARKCVADNLTANNLAENINWHHHSTTIEKFAPAAKYDLITFNPPHLPLSKPFHLRAGAELSLCADATGRNLHELAISRVPELLNKAGSLLLCHTSVSDISASYVLSKQLGLEWRERYRTHIDIPYEDLDGDAIHDIKANSARLSTEVAVAVAAGSCEVVIVEISRR